MQVPDAATLAGYTRPLSGWIWRVVETQHYAQTRELVGTHADQARLEELLDRSKPPYRTGTEHLDYLLKTPFRYEPSKDRGSRFRRPFAGHGAFYGAEHRRTALAEFAYHRYRFLQASQGTAFPRGEDALTVFAAGYRTDTGLDLTQPPLVQSRPQWTDPVDYRRTQRLGEQAAEAGMGAIRYESVRDSARDAAGNRAGRNVAVIDPATFDPPHHCSPQTWYLYIGQLEANARRTGATPAEQFDFSREQLTAPGQ